MFVFQICMLYEIFIMTNVCVFARFVYVRHVCVFGTKPVEYVWHGPMKILARCSGLTCCVTCETFGWWLVTHGIGINVSQAKRTYGRTVSDGKRQTVTVRYCSRQKIGYAFPHVIWVTNYWKSSVSLTYSLKLPGNYRWLRVTLRIPVLGEPGRNR